MALVNPNNKNSKEFNPNVDNREIASNANSAGKIITYISFILILPAILYLLKRNELVRLQMKINEASSGIDVQLKKRRDTLIKLVDAVKGDMKFERGVLTDVTKLRQGKSLSTEKTLNLTDKVSTAFNIQVEKYPDLKSPAAVQKLMNASTEIELEIAASRRLYNAYVNQFNTSIFVWPGSVIATAMNLKKLPLFAASAEDKKDVKIAF